MKEIELTQNKVALVDDDDYEWLNQWKWFAHTRTYTIRPYWYAGRSICINGKDKQIWMHRIIMNTPSNLQVDHRDHNGLNNQKLNLRNCTRSQNGMNRIGFGVSKYLGVSYCTGRRNNKTHTYLLAHIQLDGRSMHLGNFKTEEEAAHAYDKKAKELFGEFANLNFPNE